MILGRLSITLNCNIASADEDIFSYGVSYTPLSIGARAHVGNVDFVSNPITKAYPNKREKAIARSSAVVHGNVNAFAYSIDMPEILKSKNKIVQNGKIYHLKDRELLNSLTVQAGGTLIIGICYDGTGLKGYLRSCSGSQCCCTPVCKVLPSRFCSERRNAGSVWEAWLACS